MLIPSSLTRPGSVVFITGVVVTDVAEVVVDGVGVVDIVKLIDSSSAVTFTSGTTKTVAR